MKTSGIPISSFSPKVQAQILAQLAPPGPAKAPLTLARASAGPGEPGTRLRQRQGPKLNKTEAEFGALGLPPCVRELVFARPRRWRFDYAWPDQKVALEVEGGVFSGGRHNRGRGFLDDMEKYNAAAVIGWRVVRCTPETLETLATVEMIKKMLGLA